jgi:SAM-dependent methyltransferase
MRGMDILAYNRAAWDHEVASGNRWTVPVGADEVARARGGDFQILLTPTRPVPASWFPELRGTATLCLASGGGQQGPLLAAAGARVTAFDNSPAQLAQDRLVAEREGLALETVEGDMADLSRFADASFGLIFHPCSNCFAPEIRGVWRECYRVLQPGGVLLAGFSNPVRFLFPAERTDGTDLTVRYRIPFADDRDLEANDLQKLIDQQEPLAFGHTLDDQIGGQLDAGFVLTGFFEDRYTDTAVDPLSEYMATFVATRAVKPG